MKAPKPFDAQASDALAAACMAEDLEAASKALARGADPSRELPAGMWSIHGERPAPLHAAFRRGDAAMAALLMEAGADFDARAGNGSPMAHWISGSACALAWIGAGGDPWRSWTHFQAKSEHSLAHRAARWGDAELWRELAAGFDPARGARVPGSDSGARMELGEQIVRWCNKAAAEALGAAGWIAGRDLVEMAALDVASHRIAGSKARAKSAAALCAAMMAHGAPGPDPASSMAAIAHVGRPAWESACQEAMAAWLLREAKAIAKAARAPRRGSSGPRPRL